MAEAGFKPKQSSSTGFLPTGLFFLNTSLCTQQLTRIQNCMKPFAAGSIHENLLTGAPPHSAPKLWSCQPSLLKPLGSTPWAETKPWSTSCGNLQADSQSSLAVVVPGHLLVGHYGYGPPTLRSWLMMARSSASPWGGKAWGVASVAKGPATQTLLHLLILVSLPHLHSNPHPGTPRLPGAGH